MQSDTFDRLLESVCERWNLLRHPFYEAWVAGTLTRAELRDYAIQYGHIVAAIPTWLEESASLLPPYSAELKAHAADEAQHIDLWNQFAAALGIGREEIAITQPNSATVTLLQVGTECANKGQGAAAVWALESQSPAVSSEKLRGLAAHYNIDANSGAQYFALHAELDKEHERQLRDVMRSGGITNAPQAFIAANATAARLWDLLSSVYASGATK